MRWHQGTIAEAVTAAKANRAIFVVFLYGKDEQSKKMDESLNEESLFDSLSGKYVSLRLEADSESAKQFSQIYPVVIIPSLFFIGANGIPLEVIGGYIEPQQLVEKINKILDLHDQQKEESATGGETNTTASKTPELGAHSKAPESTSQPISEEISSKSEDISDVKSTEDTTENDTPQADLNERIERTKAIIGRRQQEKAKEEFENEKQKEIERRQLGKNLQEFKQRQKEMENKKLAEELARDRAEEQAAREKIRQQIARDRAERATKYKAEKDVEEAKRQELLQAQRAQANSEAANQSQYARLQLKFPDATSVVHKFEADAKLQEVYNFVKETVKPSFASFRLCLIFPRRDFQQGDYSQTLRDLQLVPNASLLIIPESSKSVIQSAPGVANFLWVILSPILAMWRYFYNFIFGTTPTKPAPQNRSSFGARSGTSASSDESGRPESKRPRLREQEVNRPFTRREGNIHRIADENDSQDENNTWNGNSTQQM